jgi:2-polyprenyl-3-methyl-5-hydroxy-6-metoxy-1,4-benzoquinol methylase
MSCIYIGEKKLEYYNGLIIRADLNSHQQIAAKVKELLPNGGKILDLGCGQGALSGRLHDMGYDVTAVDTNPADFECKTVPLVQVNFNHANEVDAFLNKYSESFDLVLGIEVIEHVHNHWEYVETLKKTVKPNGFLLISTPNITSWVSRLFFLFKSEFHQFQPADLEYGHINPIAWHQLKYILEQKNLKVHGFYPVGTLPPIWLRPSLKWFVVQAIALLVRPFQRKDHLEGWSLMVVAQKPT